MAPANDGPPVMAVANRQEFRLAEPSYECTGVEFTTGGERQRPERGGLRQQDVVDEFATVALTFEKVAMFSPAPDAPLPWNAEALPKETESIEDHPVQFGFEPVGWSHKESPATIDEADAPALEIDTKRTSELCGWERRDDSSSLEKIG